MAKTESVVATTKNTSVGHKEFNWFCRLAKSHKNANFSTSEYDLQQSHRVSQLVAFTVVAVGKIQTDDRFKDLTDCNQIVLKAFDLLGIKLERIDLDRSLQAFQEIQANQQPKTQEVVIPPTQEVVIPTLAVANTINYNQDLLNWIDSQKATMNKFDMEKALVDCGNTKEIAIQHMQKCGYY